MTGEGNLSELLQDFVEGGRLKAALIYQLSEPQKHNLETLQALWPSLPVDHRRLLMSRLLETSENDFQADFTDVALMALRDEDSEVRQHAVGALWTGEGPAIVQALIDRLGSDPSTDVRAAAASSLGRFVMEGEFEEIPRGIAREVEEALLRILSREPDRSEVYRRALESVAFSSRKEVTPLIERAAQANEVDLRAAALFAMGHNSDERWARYVLEALDDSEPQLRFEAARTSGEMGLERAVPQLIKMAQDSDPEIKEIAIWSLGEIGGSEAQEALFRLADAENDADLLETIEDAINMASLMSGDLGLYVMPGDDDDDFDDFDDEEISSEID